MYVQCVHYLEKKKSLDNEYFYADSEAKEIAEKNKGKI